jgi:hypothetical protein
MEARRAETRGPARGISRGSVHDSPVLIARDGDAQKNLYEDSAKKPAALGYIRPIHWVSFSRLTASPRDIGLCFLRLSLKWPFCAQLLERAACLIVFLINGLFRSRNTSNNRGLPKWRDKLSIAIRGPPIRMRDHPSPPHRAAGSEC